MNNYSCRKLTAIVLLACVDGALHMWQTKSNFVRPSMTIEGAHSKGTEVGSMVFSVDGRTVLTRGGDDTVKCESRVILERRFS
jgi:hypothetical protein